MSGPTFPKLGDERGLLAERLGSRARQEGHSWTDADIERALDAQVADDSYWVKFTSVPTLDDPDNRGDVDPVVEVTITDVHPSGNRAITLDVSGPQAVVKWYTYELVPGAAPLRSRMLTRLGFPEMEREISRMLPVVLDVLAPGTNATRFTPPRPGRGGHTDEQYAIWARDYVAACAEDPSRPVQLLVERHPGTSAAGWRRWIAEAKRRKLIAGRPLWHRGARWWPVDTEGKEPLGGIIK